MREKWVTATVWGLAAVLTAAGALAPATAAAQAAEDGWVVPRTPDGRADLQGVWANNNITPLQRPEVWAGRETLSDEELAALRVSAATAVSDGDALFGDQLVLAAIAGVEATSYDPTTGNYNQFWIVERDFNNRTSLVVDPPDGRIPAVTAEARERFRAAAEYRREHPADSFTDRPLQERCVTYGVPSISAGYNNYYQVFQSADHVVILHEMIHDARVIPLTGQPHLPGSVRQLHGRLAGLLGGRHPRRRDDELLVDRELPRVVRRPPPGRAADPDGSPDPGVRGHRHRPDGVDAAVDRQHSADAERRADVRVRLPRGQHRDGRHSRRPPRRGARRAVAVVPRPLRGGADFPR